MKAQEYVRRHRSKVLANTCKALRWSVDGDSNKDEIIAFLGDDFVSFKEEDFFAEAITFKTQATFDSVIYPGEYLARIVGGRSDTAAFMPFSRGIFEANFALVESPEEDPI